MRQRHALIRRHCRSHLDLGQEELPSPRPILDTLHPNLLKHMLLKDLKDRCLSTPPLLPLSLVEFHNVWPRLMHRLLILATEDSRRRRLLIRILSW